MAAKKAKTPKKPKAPVSENAISVSAHPRAAYSIRRAKGFGGGAGLGDDEVAPDLHGDHPRGDVAGDAADEGARRGVDGEGAGYVAAWVIAVQVWRHLVVAEARAAADRLATRLEQRAEAAAAETA